MTVWELDIAAVDVETTGLSLAHDRVVEVAVVRGRLGGEPERWSTLVHPGRRVAATHIHGIDDDMVARAPTFGEVAPRLATVLFGACVVAHNAPFDLGFLAEEHHRAGLAWTEPPHVDTLSIARRNYRFGSNSLVALCARHDIPLGRAHRALADAEATWRLLGALLRPLDPGRRLDPHEVRDLRRPDDHAERVRARLATAKAQATPVVIEYDSSSSRTRRTITVQQVDRRRVRAWCHLRDAEREFSIERIASVEGVDGTA
jgi:DNA polymerase-3 subunit epsilon